MIVGLGIVLLCAIAFLGWEAFQLVQRRKASARRRVRWGKSAARQKAWDVVFGRRAQKRLSHDPAERAED